MSFRYFSSCGSPLGRLLLTSDGDALTGLWMEGQRYFPDVLPDEACCADLPLFGEVKAWLSAYFGGENPTVGFPVSLVGTPFRREVWDALRAIPYGETMTYGELAGRLARQNGGATVSARAVGQAVGRNPVSIVVPCHRIVGACGRLAGYAGGLDRKQFLLRLEGAVLR